MDLTAKAPVLRTPFTDALQVFGTFTSLRQGVPQCQRFELKYLDCMEAYGVERGSRECSDIFEDFYECQRGNKQEWRYNQMKAERAKKIKEGKLDEKYMKSPEPEVIYPLRL